MHNLIGPLPQTLVHQYACHALRTSCPTLHGTALVNPLPYLPVWHQYLPRYGKHGCREAYESLLNCNLHEQGGQGG